MELHACYFKDLGAFSTDQRRASATAGKTGTRATGQRNWPTHPAVPPGTDDQNSTPARELEPPQPLLRSLDGGQHPCAKIGVSGPARRGRRRASTVTGPAGSGQVERQPDDQGLLDTSVVLDLSQPEVLAALPVLITAISTVTLAELSAGVHAARHPTVLSRQVDLGCSLGRSVVERLAG